MALAPRLGPRPAARPLGSAEQHLPDPHRLRGDLDAFVGPAELHGAFQVEVYGLGDGLHHLGGRRADIGQLLFPGDVDVEVFWAWVDADDHALVSVLPGRDEELAP